VSPPIVMKHLYRLSAMALVVCVPLWVSNHLARATHRDGPHIEHHPHGDHSHEHEGHQTHSASDHELASACLAQPSGPTVPILPVAHPDRYTLVPPREPAYQPGATGDPPRDSGFQPDRPYRGPPAPHII